MTKSSRTANLPRSFWARKWKVAQLAGVIPLAFAFAWTAANGQDKGASGKDVFENICSACHATGKDGAPKIGNSADWSNRASQGLSSLTQHALDGIRKMPAHGGNSELTNLEISRAITYMVNRSGGNWVEPGNLYELTAERSGAQVVETQCVKCHQDGLGGAPKIGDKDAWVQRIKSGLGYLVRSAIHGHGGMPSRGGQADLTDTEFRSAILYMYNPAGAVARPALADGGADPDTEFTSSYKSAEGIDIYWGLVPAQELRAFPEKSAERAMHGGIPRGPGYYHVNVSLYDKKTGAPISDALVQLQLESHRGLTGEAVQLEPMRMNAGSYGNFIRLDNQTNYRVTFRIRKPGAVQFVTATFKRRIEYPR